MKSGYQSSGLFSKKTENKPELPYPSKRHPGEYHFYVIDNQIGDGEFGQVYRLAGKRKPQENGVLVFHKSDSKVCKEFNIDEEFTIEDIKNETAIAQLTGLGKALITINPLKKAYLIQNLIPGISLFDFVTQINLRNRLVSFTDRESLWEELIYSVMKLHSLGVIHSDIQPDNFLVYEKDDLYYINPVDYGVSQLITNNKSQQKPTGTIGYIAPEIVEGKNISFASDVYSTGIVGSLFFGAATPEILNRTKSDKRNLQIVIHEAKNYSFPYLFKDLDITECSRKGLKQIFDNMVTEKSESRFTIEKIWDETQVVILKRRLIGLSAEESSDYKKAFELAANIRKQLLTSTHVTKDLIEKIKTEVSENWSPQIYQMFCKKLHESLLLGAKSKKEILDRLNSLVVDFELKKQIFELKIYDLKMLSDNFDVKYLLETCTAISAKCQKSPKTPEQLKLLTTKLKKCTDDVSNLSASVQHQSSRSSSIRRSQ